MRVKRLLPWVVSMSTVAIWLFGSNVIAHALLLEWEIGNRFRAFDYVAKNSSVKSAELFETFAPGPEDRTIDEWLARRVKATEVKNGRDISPYTSTNTGPWIEDESGNNPHYDKSFVKLPQYVHLRIRLGKSDESEKVPQGECVVMLDSATIGRGACGSTIVIGEVSPEKGRLSIQYLGQEIVAIDFSPQLKIILGLGDSYGAGEGAPDQPTLWKKGIKEKWFDNRLLWEAKRESVQRWVESPASWYSNRCNRSFFSAQSMVALRYAQQNPQVIVSFVHLACAGAEVIDGLLAPQRLAPGMPRTRRCDKAANGSVARAVDKECDVPQSQLAAAVDLLCKKKPVPLSPSEIKKIRSYMNKITWNRPQIEWITSDTLRVCAQSDRIIPDRVLVQVGGNDIGFAGIIAWALLPSRGHSRNILGDLIANGARSDRHVVCPSDRIGGCIDGAKTAVERIDDLQYRYDALAYVLESLLGATGNKVVLPGYPNPLYDVEGKLCRNTLESTDSNEWSAAKLVVPSRYKPWEWQMNLTATGSMKPPGEADAIETLIIPGLNKAIATAAIKHDSLSNKRRDWLFVDVASAMDKKGWCTHTAGAKHPQLLSPGDLVKWNAYNNQTRRIRTSNDSVMSQWPNARRDDWLSGTFHPNAWGYAATANAIWDLIKQGPPAIEGN